MVHQNVGHVASILAFVNSKEELLLTLFYSHWVVVFRLILLPPDQGHERAPAGSHSPFAQLPTRSSKNFLPPLKLSSQGGVSDGDVEGGVEAGGNLVLLR